MLHNALTLSPSNKLIRPIKENVLSLVKQMAPQYLESFRDLRERGISRALYIQTVDKPGHVHERAKMRERLAD